jgi:hypothetical protein
VSGDVSLLPEAEDSDGAVQLGGWVQKYPLDRWAPETAIPRGKERRRGAAGEG